MDWRSRASCLDEDPELFFPIGNTGPAIAQAERAKAVCARCEVVSICLAWALDNNQDAGVWGGTSEEERRAMKRNKTRARRAPHFIFQPLASVLQIAFQLPLRLAFILLFSQSLPLIPLLFTAGQSDLNLDSTANKI